MELVGVEFSCMYHNLSCYVLQTTHSILCHYIFMNVKDKNPSKQKKNVQSKSTKSSFLNP